MRVHVLGPNLFGSDTDEAFHVHAEGCADVKRKRYYRGAPDHLGEWGSLVEIAEYIYDFEEDPAELIHDFHVFPCASALPDHKD